MSEGFVIPDTYQCGTCDRKHVKLWRMAQSFDVNLTCARCVGVQDITDEGKVPSGVVPGHMTDQLPGSLVPAVPVFEHPDVETYWGYTSVPPKEVQWWKDLPN